MVCKKNILNRVGFYEVVHCLSRPKRFTDIRKETGLNPVTLNKLLIYMMDDGLVEKIIDQADRKVKYSITSKGKKYKELAEIAALLKKASEKISEKKKLNPTHKLLLTALTKNKEEINSAFCKAIKIRLDLSISKEEARNIFSLTLEKISST